jgi:adenylate kinase
MDLRRVVGIYGVSGCGKSHTLATIRKERFEWRCMEGRQVIEDVLLEDEDGKVLADFSVMSKNEQTRIRLEAADRIRSYRGVTLVSGHCSFLTPKPSGVAVLADKTEELSFDDVFTQGDAKTYDTILYLEKDAREIFQQREGDQERKRPKITIYMIEKWIQHEKDLLVRECEAHGIPFSLVHKWEEVIRYIDDVIVSSMATETRLRSNENLSRAVRDLPRADVYLLIDGDRTITPEDTGRLFFKSIGNRFDDPSVQADPLKSIFKRFPNYSFQAFLAVAMLYGVTMSDSEYQLLSRDCGTSLQLYPAWKDFLLRLPGNVHPILISCSNREIWHASLQAHGLVGSKASPSPGMSILAGNNIGIHNYIVDGDAKALAARVLRKRCPGCYVISFGDSGLCFLSKYRSIVSRCIKISFPYSSLCG